MNRDKLISRLDEAGLARISKIILERAEPCVNLITTPEEEAGIKRGATKVGGSPETPDSLEWPRNGDYPLSFLVQINLAEVAKVYKDNLLPKSGWLWFFYDTEDFPWGFDPADRDGWKVLFFDGPLDKLKRREPPEELEDMEPFTPCSVELSKELSIPSVTTLESWDMELTEEESDAYLDLLEQLDEEEVFNIGDHQLLGYPMEIQGEMSFELEAVTNGINMGGPEGFKKADTRETREGAKEWRLLLQVDSDENADMMWGDLGRLYFWIRRDDLIAGNFNKVWMILQCA
jgi:uncharacterized protein YwqG